jgi:glycosyltransferase involved in cell wall biosynthesis
VLPSISTPHWQEQFGMAMIEAMACGRPVISTQSGAIPEVIGDAGVLVPPNDFGALSDALEDLIESSDLCVAMGAAARERAVAEFDLNRAAAAMTKALARC